MPKTLLREDIPTVMVNVSFPHGVNILVYARNQCPTCTTPWTSKYVVVSNVKDNVFTLIHEEYVYCEKGCENDLEGIRRTT